MSQQRGTGSGSRRNAGKAGKKISSGGKPTLEPLPELPDGSAAEDTAQAEASLLKAKQTRARTSPRNAGSRAATASTSTKVDISFGKVVTDSGDVKAPMSAGTVTEQKKTTLDETLTSVDSNAAQQAHLQRPRSRTASPWRGRGRGAGGIFVRNAHHKQNANRQSLGVAHSSGQSDTSPYKYQHDQSPAVDNGASANNGSMSAGTIPDNISSTAAGVSSTAAQRDTDTGLSAAQRRRGRTLDPEHLATRNLSPTGTDGSANDGHKTLAPNIRPALSATTPHFSIATSNAALARYEDKHQLEVLASRPAQPVKTDSGSSGSTVQTIEIKHSPQSSIHSVDQMTTVPRGQLSKILYKETSAASSINGSQLSLEDGGNNNHSGANSVASAGRTRRSGSGGESRLGDYKGALVRPPPQSVFGTRARQSTTDLGYSLEAVDASEQQAGAIAQSGPQEIPGAYISRVGSNQSAHQSLRQSQGSVHNVRSGHSPGDEAWDIASGSKPLGRPVARDSSRDALSGTQQTRSAAQQSRHSRGIWLYTPPGDRLAADSVAAAAAAAATGMATGTKIQPFMTTPRTARTATTSSTANANALSASDVANTASTTRTESSSAEHQRLSRAADAVVGAELLHHRRSSAASTRAMPINIDESSILPHLNPTGSDMAFGGGKKIMSGSSSGKLDSIHSGGYSSDPLKLRNGSTKLHDSLNGRIPASPWSFIPASGKKRTLKFHYSGRWNAIAAGPNNEPRAAVAGREGLFVFDMGPDKISQQNYVSSGRRRSMATDFKDVIWRPSDYIITGSNDGTVSIWDPTRWSESMLRKYNEIARPVNRLAHKPDDPNFVYSAFSDGSIIGWDIRAPNRAAGLRITASLSPNDIDCNPLDANMIAAISNEGRISIWDIRKLSKPLDGFSAHSASTGQCIAWHPNGRFIASSGTDSLIKVWDMKSSSSSKRYSGTAYCNIKTLVNVHRLQWRPGYDTQISSCAFVNENHLQVWDMHNPNHSLFYHDKHADKITGFTWFDKNLVWSVGRDSNIIQCDMESDSIYTSGLVGNTVVDFSLSSYIAIATGSATYMHGGCFTQSKPLYPHGLSLGLIQHPSSNAGSYSNHSGHNTSSGGGGPANSSKSTGGAGDGINMAMFQARLPESYVDEHRLDPSVEVKSLAISELAKRYRYDPDAFRECCEENAKSAASVGLADVSSFWRLLSVAFGDALPLNAERKTGKARRSKSSARAKRRLKKQQRSAAVVEGAAEMATANAPAQVGGDGDAGSSRTGVINSTATSRSSSGMFASKSVIDSLPQGHSSDDEPYSKFMALESMANMSQQLTSTSSTQPLQQRTFGTSVIPSDSMATDNTNSMQKFDTARQGLSMSVRSLGFGAKLDRKRISTSHTNLQQAATSNRKVGRLPSPFSRTAEHSLSSSSGAFASEPTTPLQKVSHQTFHDNHTIQLEPSLMPTLRVTGPGGYLKGSVGIMSKNREALAHDSTLKLALQNAASNTLAAGQATSIPKGDNPGLGITAKYNGASTNNHASATDIILDNKLQIGTQKRTTKTELKMAIESCQYYADTGDVQTAVTAALLLRNFIKLPNWKAAEAWFWAYIGQLDSYKEYALATEILLASPFESVSDPILEYNTVTMKCSHCGAQLAQLPDVGISQCPECHRKSNSCVICQEPVISRYIWCQGCGHGGHSDHMVEWFDEMKQSDCPSGCGHVCQSLFSASV